MTRLDGEAGSPSVADHDFAAPEGRPWDRCTVCGYSEAAHERVPRPYVPTSPRAAAPGPFGVVPRP